MIVTGGDNVYSTEVENLLYMHSAILEAAVAGVPDEEWGEAVKALKSVDFMGELAKTGAGKIYQGRPEGSILG